MDNMSQFYITEEELLNKAGFNKEKAVITGVEFNSKEGSIMITIRSSEEVKGVTGKVGNNIRHNKLLKDDTNGNTYNITINTYGCDTKSPEELAEKFIKAIKEKGANL